MENDYQEGATVCVNDYEKLPKQFTGTGEVKGFTFTQIAENNKAYVYAVTQPESDATHYEVVKKKVNKGGLMVMPNGQSIVYKAKETYPKSTQFGINGWCYRCKEKAFKHFNDLLKHKQHGNTARN
jgi:hypothetical protein